MKLRVLALVLCCGALSATAASAQTVEMIFTPAIYQQAVALKDALKVDKVNAVSFGTLALVGAPKPVKQAYAEKVSHMTAVVIVGEDALKAVSEVEFSVPIVTVNAVGRTAAKNRVIRVFDTNAGTAVSGAVLVNSPGDARMKVIGGPKEIALKGDVGPIVQAVLASLK